MKSGNRYRTLTQSTKRVSLLLIENLRRCGKLKEGDLLRLDTHSQTIQVQLGKDLRTEVAPVSIQGMTLASSILQ